MNSFKQGIGLVGFVAIIAVTAGCDESITDFGFRGTIEGMIVDPAGNIVSGDAATADFRIRVLGLDTNDELPQDIVVTYEGRYRIDGSRGLGLYPQRYAVWIDGPVIPMDPDAAEDSPLTLDLTGASVTQDFTVVPFLTIPPPTAGPLSGDEVTISYSIAENEGQVAAERRVFVSTASNPGILTGTVGNVTHTIAANLVANSGEVTVTGLQTDRPRYHIRIGARADGTSQWNMSEQIIIEMP